MEDEFFVILLRNIFIFILFYLQEELFHKLR